jgi:hypothetical protein
MIGLIKEAETCSTFQTLQRYCLEQLWLTIYCFTAYEVWAQCKVQQQVWRLVTQHGDQHSSCHRDIILRTRQWNFKLREGCGTRVAKRLSASQGGLSSTDIDGWKFGLFNDAVSSSDLSPGLTKTRLAQVACKHIVFRQFTRTLGWPWTAL